MIASILVLSIIAPQAKAARPGQPVRETAPGLFALPDPLVRRVQEALAKAGKYDGPATGRMTPALDRAVRAYQRSIGIKADGRITKKLVLHIETGINVSVLLKRLERTRRSNIETARQALLDHPATRGLITSPEAEKADPTRDPSGCFKAPTARCLLAEASESAKAIAKDELRDWALGEILAVQAKANLTEAAMKTTRRIRDPRLIMVALGDIAEAQAASNRNENALAAAAIIPDPAKRAEALSAIAAIQVTRGDKKTLGKTVERLLEALEKTGDGLKRAGFLARSAVILYRSGDQASSERLYKRAETLARSLDNVALRDTALRTLASALADMGRAAEALTVLETVSDDNGRTPVLVTAAIAQAEAGNSERALETAESIDAIRYRAVVLGRIAVAQAASGKLNGAKATLDKALKAAGKITLPYAKSYAISRIALAWADIALIDKTDIALTDKTDIALFTKAEETALTVGDARLRAYALWTIATLQRRAGDTTGEKATKANAIQAERDIISPTSRVWMHTEIAMKHAGAGETGQAWAAFGRGMDIAKTLDSAWGRSRTLARLASTLITLLEADAGKKN